MFGLSTAFVSGISVLRTADRTVIWTWPIYPESCAMSSRPRAIQTIYVEREEGGPFARMADVSIPPKWPSSTTMTGLADEKSTSLQETNTLTHANHV